MDVWRCSRCLGEPDVREERLVRAARSVDEENPRQCSVCDVRMRRGQNGMVCSDCGLVVHNKCCGMSRWERERGGPWRCERCRSGGVAVVRSVVSESGESEVERERLPAGKCDGCKRLRRRGQGIACVTCKCILHVKCAALGTRGRAQAVDRSVWECDACVKQRGEREVTQGSVEPLGDRTGGGPQSIVIMQWNCDHFSSKIPELEVWLRRNDVDVAVVQE